MSAIKKIADEMKIIAKENPWHIDQNPIVPYICLKQIILGERIYNIIFSKNIYASVQFYYLSIGRDDMKGVPSDPIVKMIIEAFDFKNFEEYTNLPAAIKKSQRQFIINDDI